MALRTDLAIEQSEKQTGYLKTTEKNGEISICKIENREEKYITVSFEDIQKITDYGEIKKEIKKELSALIGEDKKSFLLVGLGNREITPDSIGPLTAERILATRHISGAFAEQIGLKGLKKVAVIVPNVLGKTGVETGEFVESIVKKTKPDIVIAIDALAAGSMTRLFRTVQLTNTGISPGSGVKNSRKELSENTLGVPVIAVGVPTVMTAESLSLELCGKEPENTGEMIVTPKDNDLLCHRISEILASALNETLQPEIAPEILSALV